MLIDLTKWDKLACIRLGYVGENNALALSFSVPAAYRDGDIYLDWSLPNGLVTQVPLENGCFTVPHEFLTRPGAGKCNVLYKKGDVKQLVRKLDVEIENAINAQDGLVVQYKDVLQDLKERMQAAENAVSGFHISVGDVETVPFDAGAEVTKTGDFPAAVLNFKLPRGPEGPQGLQGETGTVGPQGAAATVEVGAVTTGAPGTEAAVSNAGTSGAAVLDFVIPRGNTGAQGPKGETGAVGPAGPKGDAGETGPVGPKGDTGDTGETGPKGDTGDTGPQGPKGETGDTGPQGESGPAGPQGPQGPQGERGRDFTILGYFDTLSALQAGVPSPAAGAAYGVGTAEPYSIYIWDGVNAVWADNGTIQGPKGDPGDTGPQGEQGPAGEQGSKGDTGDTGEAGPQGPQGDPGETGPQGDTGDAGATGPTGPNEVTAATATNISGLLRGNGSAVSAAVAGVDYVAAESDPTVPAWAKAASKPSYTAGEVGAVPTSRTVNGKALSGNIMLTAADVGAAPGSHVSDAVNTSAGSHGLRWYDDKLSYNSGSSWVEIKTGGGGLVYSATAPTDTGVLWLDSSNGGAAKFYNGGAWVSVPAVWG